MSKPISETFIEIYRNLVLTEGKRKEIKTLNRRLN